MNGLGHMRPSTASSAQRRVLASGIMRTRVAAHQRAGDHATLRSRSAGPVFVPSAQASRRRGGRVLGEPRNRVVEGMAARGRGVGRGRPALRGRTLIEGPRKPAVQAGFRRPFRGEPSARPPRRSAGSRHARSEPSHKAPATSHQPPATSHQPSAISHQPSATNHQPRAPSTRASVNNAGTPHARESTIRIHQRRRPPSRAAASRAARRVRGHSGQRQPSRRRRPRALRNGFRNPPSARCPRPNRPPRGHCASSGSRPATARASPRRRGGWTGR